MVHHIIVILANVLSNTVASLVIAKIKYSLDIQMFHHIKKIHCPSLFNYESQYLLQHTIVIFVKIANVSLHKVASLSESFQL